MVLRTAKALHFAIAALRAWGPPHSLRAPEASLEHFAENAAPACLSHCGTRARHLKGRFGSSLDTPATGCGAEGAAVSRRKEVTNMKLLTKELLKQLPPLYACENEQDPLVRAKFFYPDFSWTWYAIEFDGQDTFFGLVDGFDKELGYFSLKELQSNRGKLGLPIERDVYFEPCRLSTLMGR